MGEPSFDTDGKKRNRGMILMFQNWALSQPVFKEYFGKFCPGIKVIIEDSLSELHDYTPIAFKLWWFSNHNRYRAHGIDSLNLRHFHTTMERFLCYVVAEKRKGNFDEEAENVPEGTGGTPSESKAIENDGTDSDRGVQNSRKQKRRRNKARQNTSV